MATLLPPSPTPVKWGSWTLKRVWRGGISELHHTHHPQSNPGQDQVPSLNRRKWGIWKGESLSCSPALRVLSLWTQLQAKHCVPQNSYVKIQTPNLVIVLGDGIFGRWLDHQGRAPMNIISGIRQVAPESSPILLSHKDTRRSLALTWSPWSQTFILQNYKEISVVYKLPKSVVSCYSSPTGLRQTPEGKGSQRPRVRHPHPTTWESVSLCKCNGPQLACPKMCLIIVQKDGTEDFFLQPQHTSLLLSITAGPQISKTTSVRGELQARPKVPQTSFTCKS